MKKIQQFCAAVILTLVLAFHALAGQMETLIAISPPPTVTTEGQITTMSGEAVDPVTEMAISLLQSVLPLF